MNPRRLTAVVGVAGAIVGGVIVAVGHGGPPSSPPSAAQRLPTATVLRTDLVTTTLTGGTLGYAPMQPLVNQLTGTYTQLPPEGSTVGAGQVLYRVDDRPVVLMDGTVPSWRDFAPAMSAGPDVAELQVNLIALGDARGLIDSPTGRMDAATVDALERWQGSEGMPASGVVPWGQVQFLPSTARVGAVQVSPGQRAAPGDNPAQLTTTTRTVIVPLAPTLPSVTPGERVSITLPNGARTPGRVASTMPVPQAGPSTPGPASSSSPNAGPSEASGASTEAIVTPDDPGATGSGDGVAVQVSLTIAAADNVLAVPVSALLALAGGGYGVEVVGAGGRHHLVGVTTGIFAGALVQIADSDVRTGTKVVTAQ